MIPDGTGLNMHNQANKTHHLLFVGWVSDSVTQQRRWRSLYYRWVTVRTKCVGKRNDSGYAHLTQPTDNHSIFPQPHLPAPSRSHAPAWECSKHVGWISVSVIRQAIGKWWITLTLIQPTIDAKFIHLISRSHAPAWECSGDAPASRSNQSNRSRL